MWISRDEPLALRIAVGVVCLLLIVGAMIQLLVWYQEPMSLVSPILAMMLLNDVSERI